MPDPAEQLEERIHELKAGLVALSRGAASDFSQQHYKETRRLLMATPHFRQSIPSWLKTGSTLVEVKELIRDEADKRPGGKWQNRAALISEGLNPLLATIDAEHSAFEATGTIGDRIGGGGFGEVYRWHHKMLDIDFAIKVLSPSFPTQDGRYIERFFREAKILFTLSHRNIVRVFDVGLYGGRPFLRMELLHGRNLDVALRSSGRLDWKSALDMMTQLAAGLAHAHEQNVVHRDLKPSNVFCAVDGRIYIIDFGLSAFVEGELVSRLTRPGEAPAGGLFTAPELVADPGLLDVRTDIYSAGAIWFASLTGRAPAGTTVSEQLEAVPGLTLEYRRTVARTLADSTSRYESADELVAALKSLLISCEE